LQSRPQLSSRARRLLSFVVDHDAPEVVGEASLEAARGLARCFSLGDLALVVAVAVAAGSWDGAPLRCPPGISSRGLRLRFRGPGLASVRVMAVGNEVSTMSGTVAAANKILCERLPRGLDRPGSDGGSDSPKGCRHGDKEQRGLGEGAPGASSAKDSIAASAGKT
jgi:hypothetical protein